MLNQPGRVDLVRNLVVLAGCLVAGSVAHGWPPSACRPRFRSLSGPSSDSASGKGHLQLPQHLVAQQAKGALCPFDVAVGNPDPVGVGQQSLLANPARLVLESESATWRESIRR